jgi:protocatechuate 3,4-dioxygenase beta subunit
MFGRVSIAVCLGLLIAFWAPTRAGGEDDTFPLTIRDGETGQPVPNARAYVLLPEVLRRERLLPHLDEKDIGALARQHGAPARADGKGRIALPRDALDGGWCVVEHQGRFGADSFYDPDLEEVHELEIFPDTRLRLRVVGPGGAPVGGIPLSLRRAERYRYPFLWRATSAPETRGTDRQGEVVVRHLAWRLRRSTLRSCLARIEVPGVDVAALVGSAGPEDEPLVLRLPETGRLRVAPSGPGAHGRLRLTLREAPLEQWVPSIEHEVVDGAAYVFPHVGLGKRFRIDVFPFDRLYRQRDPLVVDGPLEAGREGHAEPVVVAKNILLVGRIVDEAGAPVADTRFLAWSHLGGLRTSLSGLETDAEGRFRHVVEPFLSPPDSPVTELLLELAPQGESMQGDAKVRVELALPLIEGQRELGDLVLPTAPTVLSGVVVDTQGAPVSEVYVFVCQGRALTPEEAGQRWYSPRPVASDEKDEDPTFAWSPQLRAISDAEGRFVMKGALLPEQPCRFAVHKPGYVMRAPQVARPGSTGERVVLEATGRLEGAIRLGPGIPPKYLRLLVRGRPAATDAVEPTTWGSEDPPPDDVGEVEVLPGWEGVLGQVHVPARDGVQPFVFTGLRPGRATLAVCIDSDPDPIAEFFDLEITAGATLRNPGFDPLDAVALVRTLGFSIEDHSGALPAGLEVRVFRGHDRQTARALRPAPASAGKPVAFSLAAGWASRLDVEVRAPGRRAVRIDDVREDQSIRLEPGLPVRIALPAGRRGSEAAPLSVSALPLHEEGTRYFRFQTDQVHATVTDPDQGACRFLLPTPGRWLITLPAADSESQPTTLTIRVRADGDEEQAFAFP